MTSWGAGARLGSEVWPCGRRLCLALCSGFVPHWHPFDNLAPAGSGTEGLFTKVTRPVTAGRVEAVVTGVLDGALSVREGRGVPGPRERRQGTRHLRRGVPAEGSEENSGASVVSPRSQKVRLEEGGSLRGPLASVYLSSRKTDARFPQCARPRPAPPASWNHGLTPPLPAKFRAERKTAFLAARKSLPGP